MKARRKNKDKFILLWP